MEVHKHPHDVMHKKNWSEYFLEFLMLFLAVFLGFMSENWREHIVDRRREKELMTEFVNDLKLDTTQLSKLILWRDTQGYLLDSTIQFYSNQSFPRIPLRAYQMSAQLFRLGYFYQNAGTLDQLKNAGGFRLITHREIIDTIERYDQQVKRMANRDAVEGQITVRGRELVEKLFDGKELSKIYSDSILFTKHDEMTFLKKSPEMIEVNPQYVDEYLNLLIGFRALWGQDTHVEVELKDIATHLIGLIEKEYQLHG